MPFTVAFATVALSRVSFSSRGSVERGADASDTMSAAALGSGVLLTSAPLLRRLETVSSTLGAVSLRGAVSLFVWGVGSSVVQRPQVSGHPSICPRSGRIAQPGSFSAYQLQLNSASPLRDQPRSSSQQLGPQSRSEEELEYSMKLTPDPDALSLLSLLAGTGTGWLAAEPARKSSIPEKKEGNSTPKSTLENLHLVGWKGSKALNTSQFQCVDGQSSWPWMSCLSQFVNVQ